MHLFRSKPTFDYVSKASGLENSAGQYLHAVEGAFDSDLMPPKREHQCLT